jgi:hypothetical protein
VGCSFLMSDLSDDEKDVADVAAQDVAAATAKVSQLAEAASGLAAVVPAPGQAAVDLSDDQKEMLRKATLEIATQLQTITAEMDRMKNELYGDQGLGLLKKELDQIKNQGVAFFSEKCVKSVRLTIRARPGLKEINSDMKGMINSDMKGILDQAPAQQTSQGLRRRTPGIDSIRASGAGAARGTGGRAGDGLAREIAATTQM